MHPSAILFTRQQVGELTGIDDSTLNYWSREGIIRAAEGGGGRGQHRRFKFYEVHLAAILWELRSITGAKAETFRSIADMFHEAVDVIEGYSLTQDDFLPLSEMITAREEFNKNGFIEVRDPSEPAPGVSWDWYKALWPTWAREGEDENYDHERLFALVETNVLTEFRRHLRVYREIVNFEAVERVQHSREPEPDTSQMFYRDQDGLWQMTGNDESALRHGLAYIGVDFDRLIWRLWRKGAAS